jgi:hypothetical protein
MRGETLAAGGHTFTLQVVALAALNSTLAGGAFAVAGHERLI